MAEQKRNNSRTSARKTVVVSEMGRLQPQARELEQVVLGALLLEKDAFSMVSDILKPECFYEKANATIYSAIMDLATKQEPIDMMTVIEQLKKRGELEDIGGPLYISKLTEKVASSAHIEFHAVEQPEGSASEHACRDGEKDRSDHRSGSALRCGGCERNT